MVNCHKLSERHACALVGLSRDTYRHESQASALNVQLRDQIIQTAHTRRRWGYRMIHDVLRPQFPNINHKRVYRIYTAQGLSIRQAQEDKAHRRARTTGGRCGRQPNLEHGLCERCDLQARRYL
jgi:putative transposase